MKNDYLIVHKSVLPNYFQQVIQVRKIVEDEKLSVLHACQKIGLNRSTYYKYKDFVFLPNQNLVRKALIACNIKDETGILSSLLNYLVTVKANIITINQEAPLQGAAYLTLSLGIDDMTCPIEEITKQMKGMRGVYSVHFIAVE